MKKELILSGLLRPSYLQAQSLTVRLFILSERIMH